MDLLKLRSQALRPTQKPEQNVTCDTRANGQQRKPEISSPVCCSLVALPIALPPVGVSLPPNLGGNLCKLAPSVWCETEGDTRAPVTASTVTAQRIKLIPSYGSERTPSAMLVNAVVIDCHEPLP